MHILLAVLLILPKHLAAPLKDPSRSADPTGKGRRWTASSLLYTQRGRRRRRSQLWREAPGARLAPSGSAGHRVRAGPAIACGSLLAQLAGLLAL